MLKVGVPKEIAASEKRVASTPDVVAKLVKRGLSVLVERGAGKGALIPDNLYQTAGAQITPDAPSLYAESDIVLKVQRPSINEASMLKEGALLVSLLQPATALDLVEKLEARKITAFAVELIPRITRAQNMDVLSSMSNLAGYKAVILAAASLGRVFPMMTTAAGTLPPAKVLVIGAGVAGLQAIATAKRLGAMVEAFDTRPAVAEQVKSLGATFIDLSIAQGQTEDTGGYAKALSEDSHREEVALLSRYMLSADVVITTALIPNRPAPCLITASTVRAMKPGSVVVDLAAEQGGNCELTRAGVEVEIGGVTIIGAVNLPSTLPAHASSVYAKNMENIIAHFYTNGASSLKIDLTDEITKGALVTHQGVIVNAAVKERISRAG